MDDESSEDLFSLAMKLETEGRQSEAIMMMQKVETILASQEGTESKRAKIMMNLGLMQATLHRFDEAIKSFLVSKALFEASSELLYVAQVLGNIGSCYRDLDQFEKSLAWYQDALGIYQSLGHPRGIADQKANIAYIFALNGLFAQAYAMFNETIQFYQDSGDEEKVAATMKNLQQIEQYLQESGYEGA